MTASANPFAEDQCDVLVVGAGPTGLALATQLAAFGVPCRIIDKGTDRAQESRALAVQPRTLEALRPFGLADELVRRGNPAVRLRLHTGSRVTHAQLFDIGLDDTAYPFLLFISQERTEAVLLEHLTSVGVRVERRTELESFHDTEEALTCRLRGSDGGTTTVRARYVVGCDGAHSTVRKACGTAFTGGRYPQTFVLADLDVDGLEPGTVNAYLSAAGPLLLFPLAEPAPWRLITLRTTGRTPVGAAAVGAAAAEAEPTTAEPVSLAELRALCAAVTTEPLRLHDPVWATAFSVHHRHAATYRTGRAFLAGDAAHIHSPAGGQGMNTGIQDAVNLGWKLAIVIHGRAPEALLDSYDAERRPVGAFVLRFTDRAFTAVTSAHPLLRAARTRLAPRLIPWALRFRPGRAAAFRTVSQLGIRYPDSPAVDTGGPHRAGRWRPPGPRRGLRCGPRAGDRLPDARVSRDGVECWLHEALTYPTFDLLLCGSADTWDEGRLAELEDRFAGLLIVHRLDRHRAPGILTDPTGRALARLGVRARAQLVVRPDGYIGYRADGPDLTGAGLYLARWAGRVPTANRRDHTP